MRAARISEDIIAISELRANAAKVAEHVAASGAPMIVTQHGRAAMVVLSPAAFDELTERQRVIAAVEDAIAEADAGLGIETSELVKRMQARFGPGVAPRFSKKAKSR